MDKLMLGDLIFPSDYVRFLFHTSVPSDVFSPPHVGLSSAAEKADASPPEDPAASLPSS